MRLTSITWSQSGRGHGEEIGGRVDARVAAKDIDAAVEFHGGLRHAEVVFHLRDIGGEGAYGGSAGAQFGRGGLRPGNVRGR